MNSPLAAVLVTIVALLLSVFAVIFVGVPVLKVLGTAIASTLRGFGWLLAHVASFVVGMLRDLVRSIGAVIATVVFVPLMAGNVVLGRWSAAGHFSSSILRELKVGSACLYRVVLQRPLRLVLLDGLLEGIEQRVPEALAEAPGPDQPGRRTGQFAGYTIVGSLRPGGSGAKLYVAEPDDDLRARRAGLPEQVVIKTFAITDGSSLPQIIRESRALDAARQLGLILDHGLDEQRFFYVMPYHPGESLGVAARQLHGESTVEGLTGRALGSALGYVDDLVDTLARYHHGGLWHKDVKPENIIVHAGRAHLVDLGLVSQLRSAMTLTTHGTEYFRDPEMVRLALRGVKVHQVDGAKFDIYAAGAVLYFLLENTFPAHGGLSAFAKRSPESLRWIVRRAMADYSKRYESAVALQADLRHVLGAADPFAVRPADLPSMRGEAPPFVATPPPPDAASFTRRSSAAPPPPRVHVTNWWSGAYAVAGGAERAGSGAAIDERFGAAASILTPPPAPRAFTPAPPPPRMASSARPTAAVQRATARRRASDRRREAERHVAARLHRPSTPTKALVLMTALVIAAVVAGAALFSVRAVEVRGDRAVHSMVSEQAARHLELAMAEVAAAERGAADAGAAGGLGAAASTTSVDSAAVASPPVAASPRKQPLRLVLVNSHPAPALPSTLAEVDKATARYLKQGYSVCDEDTDTIARLAVLLPQWNAGSKSADDAIEELLESSQYASIAWVTSPGRDASDVQVKLINAERAGAKERRGECGAPAVRERRAAEGGGESGT